MKYHVSRDDGHLKFTTIKNPKIPIPGKMTIELKPRDYRSM